MPENKLEEIRARHKASTPGPWRWRGNTSSHDVHLRSLRSPLNVVLDYVRWGLQGCVPVFRDERGVLVKAELIPSAPHNAWDIVGINHPDARALEYAWEDREYLLDEVDALRAFLDTEVLPRYREMFEAAHLGRWSESVVYRQARGLLR